MARTSNRRRLQKGISFIDALIGMLIAVVAIVGMLNLSSALMNMTMRHQKMTVAYNVARTAVEEVRNQGFPNYPEGQQTFYYDGFGQGGGKAPSANTMFKVVLDVETDVFQSGMSGNRPAPTANRIVTVNVADHPSNQQLLLWATLLVRGGI
jgi:Tfp pilus assembly protein PilV